ncbi:cytochrome c oxidase assembly factor 3-like protein [Naviculisporaceae sp. PSN 640]
MSGIQQRTGYYDRNHRQSPALIRARRPYLVKNTLLGTGIALFAIGIYAYTLKVVGQDEFEDVKVPDAPVTNASSLATKSSK